MYVVEWKHGTKNGNIYVRAEDEEQAFNKAITDYWRTVDDIVSVKQIHQESNYNEFPLGCVLYTRRTLGY
jgi:hypothetical protein